MTDKEYRKLQKNVDLAIIVNRGSAIVMLKQMKSYIDEHPDLNQSYVETIVRLVRSFGDRTLASKALYDDIEGRIDYLLDSNDKEISETRRNIYGLLK